MLGRSAAAGDIELVVGRSSTRVHADRAVCRLMILVTMQGVAACWIAITPNGEYAYCANAGSGTISGFRIEHDGSLVALDDDGRTGVTGEGSLPGDMVISSDGHNLYVLNVGSQTVGAFDVQPGRGLTPLSSAGGVPSSALGTGKTLTAPTITILT